MYILNERQSSIVMDLINTENPITAKDLSFKYNVSIRTIRYDIEIVEGWFEEIGLNFIKKPRMGMWLDITNMERDIIRNKLKSADPYIKVLSKDERKKVIVNELLGTSSPITSEFLCKKVGVSKTTLLEDLKGIKEELKLKGVFIKGKPGIGYSIKGNEENIRRLISQIILSDLDRFQLLDILNKEESLAKLRIGDLKEDLNLKEDIRVDDIKYAIKMSKKIYDFWIPDSSYISLIIHIAIAIDRLLSNQEITLPIERIRLLQTYKEYVLAKEISSQLEKLYNIIIPEAEVANITFHLISANLKLNYLHSENIYDAKSSLVCGVDKIIDYLKGRLDLPEESFEKLKIDILSHLKLTIKKLELNIPNTNPLLEQIKESYSKYYSLAEEIAAIFLESTGVVLTEDEIGYLTLHIAAHGELHKKELTKNTLLVCTTGKGIARILEAKLQRNFPELIIKDTVSIFDLEEGNISLKNIDLIISTFHIANIGIPVIRVSPFIAEEDIIRIRNYIYKGDYKLLPVGLTEDTYMLDSLMSVVNKYVDIEKQYKLRDELGYVLEFILNNTSNKDISNDFSLNKFSEEIAFIMIDMGQMLDDLKAYLKDEESYFKIWGLAIHIIMAIPRWRISQSFNDANVKDYTMEQQELYQIISKHMRNISNRYNLFISESEVMSIVRYFV
jgi:mannitol operon transcriptional antiterminator